MVRGNTLLAAVIEAAAERLARDQRVPDEARAAFRATAEHVMRAQFSVLLGERVYAGGVERRIPIETDEDRALRRQRIAQALAAGEGTLQVARREGVSQRYVRKLRGVLVPPAR